MFETGFLTLGRFRGVPIRLHWSTALGALLFGGLRFVPAFWLAFVVLVVVHELGHALLVQRLGHRALAVDVTGFGGLCHWEPVRATALDHYLVAWGGVLAQLALLLLTLVYLLVFGPPRFGFEAQVISAFTTTNLWLIFLNLLPIAPLDGSNAWKLFGELRRRRLSLWGLVQGWAARRRRRRTGNDSPAPKASPSQGRGKPTAAAQAELARVFAKVAEDARRARGKD